jgi:hypothetical protein
MAWPSHLHTAQKICIVALVVVASVSSSFANSLNYAAPTKEEAGRFSGELPISSVGTVRTPRGLVRFRDDELTVLAVPQWLFDRNVVLKGAIVETEVIDGKTMQGLVYFFEGEWLQSVVQAAGDDEIDLGNNLVRGKIISREGRTFLVKRSDGSTDKIAFRDIKAIKSSRAFTFSIALDATKIPPDGQGLIFESRSVSLSPTRARHPLFASAALNVPKSKLPGTEPGIPKTALVTYLALDVLIGVAPAVAIPLTLQHSTQTAALNAINKYDVQHGHFDGAH